MFDFIPITTEFKTIFDSNKSGINTFIITGNNTDFNFLNQQQNDLSFKMSGQKKIMSVMDSLICLH
jgi:hypothetical protein